MSEHLPAELADTIWAITPEAFRALVAELSAGDGPAEVTDDPVQAARLTRSGGAGGAVAVIPIMGMIRPRPSFSFFGGSSPGLTGLRAMLREAVADDQVGSIVLEVDSPGGIVDGVPETAAEIRAARDSKPIVAVANTFAASAAYWLASQATELVVAPSGQVGSIGVFIEHTEFSKMDERVGITTTLIRAGKYKIEANPFEPLTDEARDAIQGKVDDYYAMFVADVARGRSVTDKAVRAGFGEGRMVLAKPAVAEGMADRVGTLEDAVIRASQLGSKTRAEIDAPPVRTDEPPAPTPTPPAPAVSADLDLADPHVRELVRQRLASSQPAT